LTPLVSVLLPVRDAASTLDACLGSLRAQTLALHEVVAVDDGSSDETPAILARAAREDSRLRVLRTPPRGLVAALGAALEGARAPYVARMDADDVAFANRLARQRDTLEAEPGLHVLGSQVSVNEHASNQGMRDYVAWSNGLLRHEDIVRDLFVESPLVHPSVMMRARALRGLGGYRAFDGPEDYDLWLRAHRAGLRFAKLPEELLLWRDGPARLTRRDPRYSAAAFLALKLACLEATGRLGAGVVVWGAGKAGKAWARALGQRGHRVLAFVEVDPGKLGQTIHGAPVVTVEAAGDLRDALHLAAVGQPGARERIRAEALRLGLRDGRELLAVA
jgi:glycosyltransferase involved in cell wall biosynthesis